MNEKNKANLFPMSVYIERSLERVVNLLLESTDDKTPTDFKKTDKIGGEEQGAKGFGGQRGGGEEQGTKVLRGPKGGGEEQGTKVLRGPKGGGEEQGTKVLRGPKGGGEEQGTGKFYTGNYKEEGISSPFPARQKLVHGFKRRRPLHPTAEKMLLKPVTKMDGKIVIEDWFLPVLVKFLQGRKLTYRKERSSEGVGPKSKEVLAQVKKIEEYVKKAMSSMVLGNNKLQFYDKQKLLKAFETSQKTFGFPQKIGNKYKHFGLFVMAEDRASFGYFVPLEGGSFLKESSTNPSVGGNQSILEEIFNSFTFQYGAIPNGVRSATEEIVKRIQDGEFGGDEGSRMVASQIVQFFSSYIAKHLPQKNENAYKSFVSFLIANKHIKENRGVAIVELRKGIFWEGSSSKIISFQPFCNVNSDFSTNITVRTDDGEVFLSALVNQDFEVEVPDKAGKNVLFATVDNIVIALTNLYNTFFTDKISSFIKGGEQKTQFGEGTLFNSFSGISALVAERIRTFQERVSPCLYFGPTEGGSEVKNVYLTNISRAIDKNEQGEEGIESSSIIYKHLFNVLVHKDVLGASSDNDKALSQIISLKLFLNQLPQLKRFSEKIESVGADENLSNWLKLEGISKAFSVESRAVGGSRGAQNTFLELGDISKFFGNEEKTFWKKFASFVSGSMEKGRDNVNLSRIVKDVAKLEKEVGRDYRVFVENYKKTSMEAEKYLEEVKNALVGLFPKTTTSPETPPPESMEATNVRGGGSGKTKISGYGGTTQASGKREPTQRTEFEATNRKNVTKESFGKLHKFRILEQQASGSSTSSGDLEILKVVEFISLFIYGYINLISKVDGKAVEGTVMENATGKKEAFTLNRIYEAFIEEVKRNPSIQRWSSPSEPDYAPAPFTFDAALALVQKAIRPRLTGDKFMIYEALKCASMQDELFQEMKKLVSGTYLYITDDSELKSMLDSVYGSANAQKEAVEKSSSGMFKACSELFQKMESFLKSGDVFKTVKGGELISFRSNAVIQIAIIDKSRIINLIKQYAG